MQVVRQRGQTHWRDVVSRRPYAEQREWAATPEARAMMGADWCTRTIKRLNAIEQRLRSLAPSGWWYEACWTGEAELPPQEEYCTLAVVARLYDVAARGELSRRGLMRAFARLFEGIDPVQVLARVWSRMRLSIHHSAMPPTAYVEGEPVRVPPTRRLMPPQSVGDGQGKDDHYDGMSAAGALFCRDEPSVTAVQFRKIELMKGREQTDEDRRKRAERKKRREAVRAAQARAGIFDDEPDEPETILDEVIDVDCTDVNFTGVDAGNVRLGA